MLADHATDRGGFAEQLRFRVLGSVSVVDGDGRVVDVGGAKPRLILVHLLLNPNRVVSTDALVDAVWGDDPPPTARRSLQSHVARLRAALGGDSSPIVSQPPGYLLAVGETQIDLCCCEQLMHEARQALASNPRLALHLAHQARDQWTGDPLADLAERDQLVAQRRRLDRLWVELIELEIDARLAVGDATGAAEQLESLVIQRREHEPFWARLMTAYYRLGRQGDALEAYQRARAALLDALGVDPSPELQRLEVAILGQSSELVQQPAASCPYKGLASYQLDDAEMFYGRDDLVAELLEAVRTAPFVAVVGNSGAGKSSALRAGLVKALEARRLDGVRLVSIITPGASPLRSVYQVPVSADVVIVDQFEELFTLTTSEETQRSFVRVLVDMVTNAATRVVISVRADFYGYCTRNPDLAPLLARRQVVVGPLTNHELRLAITKPAEQHGLVVDGALVDAIVAEAEDHTGALPLVSHALVETWHRRTDDDRLTVAAYRDAGSIVGAIARTAERVYGGFQPAQRVQAERLFLRLVEPGEATEHARRKVPYTQLEGSSIDRNVVDLLVEARLLTADADGIEIAHEALIEAWPRLRTWIDENRDGTRLHRHLTAATGAWDELGCDEGELYRGARLSAALAWISDSAPDLSDLERDFVDASVGMSERDQRRQARANRRLRVLVGASAVAALVAAGGTVVAIKKANDAERDRAQARANELVVKLRADSSLTPSARLELAAAADHLAPTPGTLGLLLDTLLQDQGVIGEAELHALVTGNTPLSANGGVLSTVDEESIRAIVDPRKLTPTRGLVNPVPPIVVDTGSRLLGLDLARNGEGKSSARVFDLRTRETTGRIVIPFVTFDQVALSRDGSTLAAAAPASDENTPARVLVYDVDSGQQIQTLTADRLGELTEVNFSPDGQRVLAVVDGKIATLWSTTFETPFWHGDNGLPITRFAMSPSRQQMVIGRADGTVEIWQANRRLWDKFTVTSPHHDAIRWVDFSLDGTLSVTTSVDGMAVVWDLGRGEPAVQPRVFPGAPLAMTFFSSDADTLVSIDVHGHAIQWATQRAPQVLTTVEGADLGATIGPSPDDPIAVSSKRGALMYGLADASQREVVLEGGVEATRGVALSGDGSRMVVVHDDGTLELRETRSGGIVQALKPTVHSKFFDESHRLSGPLIAIDRSGSRVAYLDPFGFVDVVDASGFLVTRFDPPPSNADPVFRLNDDGSQLVLAAAGHIEWYDFDVSPDPVTIADDGFDAQFLRDGRIAIAHDGDVEVIDPHSKAVTTRYALGVDVQRFAIDETGRLLVTVAGDGSMQLWDARRLVPIGSPMRIVNISGPVPVRFSDDGHYLVISMPARTMWLDVQTEVWSNRACSLATDALTTAERARYLGSPDSPDPCPR